MKYYTFAAQRMKRMIKATTHHHHLPYEVFGGQI